MLLAITPGRHCIPSGCLAAERGGDLCGLIDDEPGLISQYRVLFSAKGCETGLKTTLVQVNAPEDIRVTVDGEALVDDGVAAVLFMVFKVSISTTCGCKNLPEFSRATCISGCQRSIQTQCACADC